MGATALIGILMLMAMIVLFTMTPGLLRGGYTVKILSRSSHDVQTGHHIYLAGMRIGVITSINFSDATNPAAGVTMLAKINNDIHLPVDTRVVVHTKGIVGSPYVEFKSESASNGSHHSEFLSRDGSAVVVAEHVGADLVPPEIKATLDDIRDGFDQIGILAGNLNRILAPANHPGQASGEAGGELEGTLAKLNRTLDDISGVFGDTQNQQNLRKTMINLAEASESMPETAESLKNLISEARSAIAQANTLLSKFEATAGKADQNMELVASKLVVAADGMANLMAQFNQFTTRLESPDSTMGQLVNDIRLYNNLLDASVQLNELLKEFRLLVDGWQRQGMGVKIR